MYVLRLKEGLNVIFHIDHNACFYSSKGQSASTFLNDMDTSDSARDPSQAKPARERGLRG